MGSKPAGRELDAEVAVACFGWTWVREDAEQPDAVPYLIGPRGDGELAHLVWYPKCSAEFGHRPGMGGPLPDYSTDMKAAMDLRNRLIRLGYDVAIYTSGASVEYARETGDTKAVLVSLWNRGGDSERIDAGADGIDSVPLALTLAALAAARKATGGGEPKGDER